MKYKVPKHVVWDEIWAHPRQREACKHEDVIQLEFLNYEYPTIHGPRTEVWSVKCKGCSKTYNERFIGE